MDFEFFLMIRLLFVLNNNYLEITKSVTVKEYKAPILLILTE